MTLLEVGATSSGSFVALLLESDIAYHTEQSNDQN